MARTESVWQEVNGSYLTTPWTEGRNILINGTNRYLNFGSVSGSTGYGFRDNAGTIQYKNSGGAWANIGSGAGGGHTIQDEGTPLTQRSNLNFVGLAVTVTDDAGNDATVVTITGGSGSGDVSKVGTPANNQIGVWTGDGTIEGDSALTFDTITDTLTVGGEVVSPKIRASSSAGLIVEANNGTDVADFGVGNTANSTFYGAVQVPDDAYDATTWNGNTTVPTKNAIRDKIESLTGVTDGDKGDITVSSSGTVWTVDNGVITLAKQADVATGTVFYRKTAGTGVPEVQTLATLKTDLGLTGTNSGDQTSIVGITGTKAQFDTAVTDGNFLYVGDITQYTDEMAQDAIGAMVDSSLTYVDGTPLLQRAALTGAVTASAGSNTTALGSFTVSQLNTALSDGNIVPEGGGTFTGDISVPDEVYGVAWNGSTEVPTKNALYDKIETLGSGSASYVNTIYIDQSGGTSDTYGVLAGTINGSNALFTVAQGVYATGTLKVWLNGQLMTQGSSEDFVETTPGSGTFTFNTAPASGSLITVEYQRVTTSGNSIMYGRQIVSTSGSATMGSTANTDYVYFVTGAHTMSLPAAAGNTNRYTVKNNHSANITIDTAGAENVEGAASISIAPEESVDIISNGTNWFVV